MVVSMAYNPNLLKAIKIAHARYPTVPMNLLIATTLVETGGNVGAVGDHGRSFGAYQEYDLGRGHGLSAAQRQDPYGSSLRAAKEFAAFYKQGQNPGWWAARAQRPADPRGYAAKIMQRMGEANAILGSGQLGATSSAGNQLTPAMGFASATGGTSLADLGLAGLSGKQPGESLMHSIIREARSSNFRLGKPVVDGPPVGDSSPRGDFATGAANGVIDAAKKMLGTPYSWGGGTPAGPGYGFAQGRGIKGFDCSSLVQYAWAKAGVKLPRTTYGQIKAGTAVRNLSQLRPGDLLFPHRGHVQMYIGNGQVIESPRTGLSVRIVPLAKRNYVAIRRPGG